MCFIKKPMVEVQSSVGPLKNEDNIEIDDDLFNFDLDAWLNKSNKEAYEQQQNLFASQQQQLDSPPPFITTNFLDLNSFPSPPQEQISYFPVLQQSIVSPKIEPTDITTSSNKRKSPVEEEPLKIILKRQKNTEAARRSRSKKAELLGTLEVQVKELESNKSNLTVRLAVLENEKRGWLSREAELAERVRQLEYHLAETHRAMMNLAK